MNTAAHAPASAPSIINRVRGILVAPPIEWRAIRAETGSTVSSIYMQYVVWLALIPVVAAFLGGVLLGGGGARAIIPGLVGLIVGYLVSLAAVFVLAHVIDALAPTFGGRKKFIASFKLAAYSATPGWLAGIFSIVPVLGVLGLVGMVYGLYLLYVGIPVLTRCPPPKALVYTIVLAICNFAIFYLIGMVTAPIVGLVARLF